MKGSSLFLAFTLCVLCGCRQTESSPVTTNTKAPANRFTVTVDGKTGYIDRSGKIVIHPQWDQAFDFAGGLALVCVGQCDVTHRLGYKLSDTFKHEPIEQTYRYGYINESGQIIINPMFENASNFSEGMAAVCQGIGCYYHFDKVKEQGKWGFIDQSGNMIVAPQFDATGSFHEGLASVSVGGKFGYIDKTGKFAVNPQYDSASEFNDGVAWVGVKSGDEASETWKYGYIDREGKCIWQPSK